MAVKTNVSMLRSCECTRVCGKRIDVIWSRFAGTNEHLNEESKLVLRRHKSLQDSLRRSVTWMMYRNTSRLAAAIYIVFSSVALLKCHQSRVISLLLCRHVTTTWLYDIFTSLRCCYDCKVLVIRPRSAIDHSRSCRFIVITWFHLSLTC